jgi:thiol-disulfide isomerase/thioredoxin
MIMNQTNKLLIVGTCLLVLTVLLGASTAGAQAVAVSDFQPVGYEIEFDGEEIRDAEIFQSRSTGSFLILSSKLPAPVLIRLREAQVETINLMKVNRTEEGTVQLLPDSKLASQPPFKITADRTGLEFSVDEVRGLLRERPPLLGHQNVAGLEEHSPEYRVTADAYTPSDPIVAKLRDQSEEVTVRVFFGSWCSHCKQMVPRIMKVAEQLEGSNIKFDFYGMPPFSTPDPEATKAGINAVPTGLIFLQGKEIGRISGSGWKVPELAINNLLVSNGNPTS